MPTTSSKLEQLQARVQFLQDFQKRIERALIEAMLAVIKEEDRLRVA